MGITEGVQVDPVLWIVGTIGRAGAGSVLWNATKVYHFVFQDKFKSHLTPGI